MLWYFVYVYVYVCFSLAQWIILGANISNIGAGGIWAILFHIGLGGKLKMMFLLHTW